jgi:hypothetical protein
MGMPVRRTPFTRKLTTSIEHEGGVYLAEVTLECCPGSPGRINGDPDDCYPPEPDTTEPIDIKILEVEEDGDEKWVGQHVDWEIDAYELADRAFEEQADADEAAWEAHWESKLDAMREGDW